MSTRSASRVPRPSALARGVGLLAVTLFGCAHPAETRRTDLRILSEKTVEVRLDPTVYEGATAYDARVRFDPATPGGPMVVVGVFASDTCERVQDSQVEETSVVLREGAPERREPPTLRAARRHLGQRACNTRPAGDVSVETRWSRWIRGSKRFDECSGFSGSTGADGLVRIPLDVLSHEACRTDGPERWRLELRIMDDWMRWPEDVEKALMVALARDAKPLVPPFPGPTPTGAKR